MIIGIGSDTGPQSGKDSVALILQYFSLGLSDEYILYCLENEQIVPNREAIWERTYFSTPLKQIISILTGMSLQELNTIEGKNKILGPEWGYMRVRDLLVDVGTNVMRKYNEKIWVNVYSQNYSPTKKWITPDLRFLNESDYIKSKKGYLICVSRPSNNSTDSLAVSETELHNFSNWDFVIHNTDSLDLLIKQVRKCWTTLNLSKIS